MDREALLAAIVAAPHEDMPRLAYADWLDENSTESNAAATAEFIRISCPPRSGNRSNNLMPGKAYQWLEDNWKRLVPGVVALHVPHDIGEVVAAIHAHKRWTSGEGDGGPVWNRSGRSIWTKLFIVGRPPSQWRPAPRKYGCSVNLTFFKGFCTELAMWSPWAERIVRPVLTKEAPLLDKFKPPRVPAPPSEDL